MFLTLMSHMSPILSPIRVILTRMLIRRPGCLPSPWHVYLIAGPYQIAGSQLAINALDHRITSGILHFLR